jgi:sec-independent protein translocase protein TatA
MFLGEIFGPDLLVVVVVVAIVIFGGSAIPKLARSLGQAKSEFKTGLDTVRLGDTPSGRATITSRIDGAES